MERREVIKRTVFLAGGCTFYPSAIVFAGKDTIFNNVFSLRGAPGKHGEHALLTGYYHANDGGGSAVFWDNESTEGDDNGMVFKVDGVKKGRWKRPNANTINVKWFGANGDGVFRTGTDNDVHAFNNCMEWIRNHETKKVYVPAGLYILSHGIAKLNSAHNGLELFGDGRDSELRLHNEITASYSERLWMLTWNRGAATGKPIKDIYIHDMKFNGNRQMHNISMSESTGYGIHIVGEKELPRGEESFNVKIENIFSCNHNTVGIQCGASNSVVKNVESWGNYMHGVSVGGSNNPINVTFIKFTCWQNEQYGINLSSGNGIKAINFLCCDNFAGAKASESLGSATLTNGKLVNNWTRGIQQTGKAADNYHFHLDGIVTENNPDGGARFDNGEKVTIGSLISIGDGHNKNNQGYGILINNDIKEFCADTIQILNPGGDFGMRIFAEIATVNNLHIKDAKNGVQGKDKGNTLTINGGHLENINGLCFRIRDNSNLKLSNIKLEGETGISVNHSSVVDVNKCDFSKVTTNYTGGGIVNYQGINKM
ncbi:MAG: hypothetical protein WD037_13595 [Balneolales bacterium]